MGVVRLPEGSWWDWEILGWEHGGELRLAASHDLTYAHGLELVFGGASYVACPHSFHDPVFREPSRDERALVRALTGEEVPVVVAFDVEAVFGGGRVPCLIAAETVEVVHGTVHRHRGDGTGLAGDPPGARPSPARTRSPARCGAPLRSTSTSHSTGRARGCPVDHRVR